MKERRSSASFTTSKKTETGSSFSRDCEDSRRSRSAALSTRYKERHNAAESDKRMAETEVSTAQLRDKRLPSLQAVLHDLPQVRQLRDRVETTAAAATKAAAVAQEEKAHAATVHAQLREEIERKREEVAAARRAHEAAAAGSSESARAELQSLREAAAEAARQADAQLEARSRELRDCQSRADTADQLAETRATECADLRRRLAALEATNSTGLAAATGAPASALGAGLPPADLQAAVPAREQMPEQESHLDAALQRVRQAEDRAADAEAALERAQHTAMSSDPRLMAARGAPDDARNVGALPGGPVGGVKTGPGVTHAAAIAAGRRYWERKLEVQIVCVSSHAKSAERSLLFRPLSARLSGAPSSKRTTLSATRSSGCAKSSTNLRMRASAGVQHGQTQPLAHPRQRMTHA